MRCCVTPPSTLTAVDGITRCSSDDGCATASGGGGGAAMLPSIEPRGSAGGGGGGATALLAGIVSFGWGGPPRRFKSDMESSPRVCRLQDASRRLQATGCRWHIAPTCDMRQIIPVSQSRLRRRDRSALLSLTAGCRDIWPRPGSGRRDRVGGRLVGRVAPS